MKHSNTYIQIRQAGTYYLDNIRMYRTYEDTMFVGGFDVDMAYRYGFNGMEKDDQIKGKGNSYTTEFRQYDPRLGEWLTIDPLFKEFPWQSPYVAFDNNPIYFKDPKGLAAEGGGNSLVSKAAKEIVSGDARSYKQFRGEGWKVDNYVDCSEFVYEVFIKAHGINVGTYTEDIFTFFKSNEKFKSELSEASIGDIIFWVNPNKKDRNVTHVGVISDIKDGIAVIQHASSSKNKLTSFNLNLSGNGGLGNLDFVGLGEKIIDHIDENYKESIAFHKDMILRIDKISEEYSGKDNPFTEIRQFHKNAIEDLQKEYDNYKKHGVTNDAKTD